jgi:hypothetical protein
MQDIKKIVIDLNDKYKKKPKNNHFYGLDQKPNQTN